MRTVHTLDKSRPMQQTILGMDMVIWWSEPQQRWNVFRDACPHRMAPLSHGRLVDGQLACSFHVSAAPPPRPGCAAMMSL